MKATDRMEGIASQRCTATAKSTGARCGRWALLGAEVCVKHGAGAPQVRKAARERIQALIHPALDRLTDLLGSDDERIALAAVKTILDRGTDEHGDSLALPVPSLSQIEAWIAELEADANR